MPPTDSPATAMRLASRPLDAPLRVIHCGGVENASATCCARQRGELGTACDRFERCAELCIELDLPAVGTRAVQLLGITKLDLGDVAGARAALGAALPALVEIGDRFSILVGLLGLSGLAARSGKPRVALRLAGFAGAC